LISIGSSYYDFQDFKIKSILLAYTTIYLYFEIAYKMPGSRILFSKILHTAVNTNNTISIPTLKLISRRLTPAEYITENQWLRNQPIDVQLDILTKLTRANIVPFRVSENITTSCILHVCKKKDSALLHERVPLLLRMLNTVVPVMQAVIQEVEHFVDDNDATQEWICALMHLVIYDFIHSNMPAFRSPNSWYYAEWQDVLLKCNNMRLFQALSEMYATVFKCISANDSYRNRILRRRHIDSMLNVFNNVLIEENFAKADTLFQNYKRHMRIPFLQYLVACDESSVQRAVAESPHIIAYIHQNVYKLEPMLHKNPILWNAVIAPTSAAHTRLALVAKLISQQYDTTTLTQLLDDVVTLSVTGIHDFIVRLSNACQTHLLSAIVQRAAASCTTSIAFIQKYPRYAARVANDDESVSIILKLLHAHSSQTCDTLVTQLSMSPSLSRHKRTLLLEWYGSTNDALFSAFFKKIWPLMHTAKRKQIFFYNTHCANLMAMPIEEWCCASDESSYEPLAGSISTELFAHNPSMMTAIKDMPARTKHIRHAIIYIFCRSIFYAAQAVQPTVAEEEGDGGGDVCAVCSEVMLATDNTYVLPCSHRMHSECLCSVVQYSTSSIKKNGMTCPYCNTNIIPLYVKHISQLAVPNNDTQFTVEQKIYNAAILRLLKLVCECY
jgi:hypothetical protein